MSNEKIYVGGAKEKNGNFGVFHSISFSAQDLETLKQNLNSKGYVNLVMNQRRTPSQYGQTHSLTIDTWEPQAQGGGGAPRQFQQPAGAPPQYQQPAAAPQQPYQQPAAAPQQPYQQAPATPQFQQPAAAPAPDFGGDRPPVSDLPNYDDIDNLDDCPF